MRARSASLLLLCACGNIPTTPDAGVDAPPEPASITFTAQRGDGQSAAVDMVAFQDGDGPWQAVAGIDGVYTFKVTANRYGLASACQRTDGAVFVTLQYAAVTDPRMRYALNNCAQSPNTAVSVSGTATGIPMGQQLLVSSGSNSSLLAPGNWTLSAQAGAGTLVATAVTSQRANSIIVRKVSYAAGATFALDFANAGFPPTESDLMLDPTGTNPYMTTTYVDEEGNTHTIDPSSVAVARYRAVPADRVGNGHTILRAQASATGASRSLERAFKIPSTQTTTLPAAYLPVDAPRYVSNTAIPTIEAIIARVPSASYYQLSYFSSVGRVIRIHEVSLSGAWAALSAAGDLTVRLPDLSAVTGYSAAFAPPNANVSWSLAVNHGPARLAVGALAYRNLRPVSVLAPGEEATSSTSNGAVR